MAYARATRAIKDGSASTAHRVVARDGMTEEILMTLQEESDLLNRSWSYPAPVGGLVSTTAPVVIGTAPGAGLRYYIASIQIQAAAGTETEFVLRETTGAVNRWRILIPSGGLGLAGVTFGRPIKCGVNAAIEIVTLTSSAGAVFCNAQGYVAP